MNNILFLRRSIFLMLSIFLFSCGSSRFVAPDRPPNDQRPVPAPESREVNLAGDNVNKLATMQVERIFDLSMHFRGIAGKPREAFNIDAFDEVYNSSWFTNRNSIEEMSLAEITRGPNSSDGPDTNGEWAIFRAKAQGVTPGFSIEDSRGDRYVIKFDPLGSPEMSTGAEAVSTKLFHAAGYNVPENYLVTFDPAILRLGDEVKLTDKQGNKRFMNQADLDDILSRIQKLPNGHIRVIASKYLPGKPMGSFRYSGVRKDDANDVIPHEHRRELRGLRVMAAWVNHYDTKDNNTLDVFVPEGYMRHYLIDFGSTLGSQGDEPMPPEIGREGPGDLKQVAKTIGSLGVYKRPWERKPAIKYPAIGNFSTEGFHPQNYKYILPNPAFLNVTNADGFWGARMVMTFTEGQIRAAVESGQYSDPEAAEYLIETLVARQRIVGEYWFSRVPSLDKFNLAKSEQGGAALCFSDLALRSGLVDAERNYQYSVYKNGKRIESPNTTKETCISLASLDKNENAQWRFSLQSEKVTGTGWSSEVNVFIEWDSENNRYKIVGIRR